MIKITVLYSHTAHGSHTFKHSCYIDEKLDTRKSINIVRDEIYKKIEANTHCEIPSSDSDGLLGIVALIEDDGTDNMMLLSGADF